MDVLDHMGREAQQVGQGTSEILEATHRHRGTRRALIAAGVGLIISTACQRYPVVKIRDIEYREFRNRTISVSGKCTYRASVLGAAIFVVDDGSGAIPIVTIKGAPRTGRQVKVRGTIHNLGSAGVADKFDVEYDVLLEAGTKEEVLQLVRDHVRELRSILKG